MTKQRHDLENIVKEVRKMEKRDLEDIKDALKEFIVNATKKGAPSYAVQTLPGAIEKYLKIVTRLRFMK